MAEENSQAVVPATPKVLSGADELLDGKTHVGVAVELTSDGKPSILMIPDVTGIGDGKPVYIDKPIKINGKNLKEFFTAKGIDLPPPVQRLIEDISIACEAFYFTTTGPLLMMFDLKFEDGLIKSLTGDEALGKLFDVKGVSARVVRCPKNLFPVLQQYAAALQIQES